MAEQKQSMHGEWSSRWAFVLAATGAAVGLGNIWKFPYITGINGGGAFVLLYLGCIVLIGIPLMMGEIMLGRRGRQNPANTMQTLAEESKRSPRWRYLGWLGILAGFIILSYYSVIAGWALEYTFLAASSNLTSSTTAEINHYFTKLIANPPQLILWHSVIMAITVWIVARGVQKGLEKSIQFMFPTMLVLLLIVVAYAMTTGYFFQGLRFLFYPDFSKLTSEGALSALGHAFFTLSLATGSIMMYGAYLPHNASITKGAIFIAISDTAVALIAGMAIFPIVFANHLTASAGPGLLFKTLPIAFSQMPQGATFATLFFAMIVFAALTSSISLIEPTVAWLMENAKLTRVRAAIYAGIVIWLLGFATIYSFNIWSHIKLFGLSIFDFLDYITANIMLPLGGLFIAIFVAWQMKKEAILDELNLTEGRLYRCWLFTLRYISPAAILLIVLSFIGVL